MFEDKFKFYEEERLKFERFKNNAADEERKVSHAKRENEELLSLIKDQKNQIDEYELKLYQVNQAVDQKDRLYSHIKDQVEDLSQQLETL